MSNQFTDDQIKIRYWDQLPGNPYLKDIDLEMVTGKMFETRWKKGESFQVEYDRTYVAKKLAKLMAPLFKLPDDELSKLLNEAREYVGKV